MPLVKLITGAVRSLEAACFPKVVLAPYTIGPGDWVPNFAYKPKQSILAIVEQFYIGC